MNTVPLEAPVSETAAGTDLQERAPAARQPRAERVLAALRHFARNGLVCQTTGTLARWLGESSDTVRRGLRDLIATGRVEDTGLRAGKARAFRLVESSQPLVESPQPAAGERTAGAPLGATPAVIPPRWGSPQEADNRDWLDSFEWTPELLADYTARARALAERYSTAGERPELNQLSGGECDDCRRPSERRERYGTFALCVPCICRRHSVAMKLEAQIAVAA